MIFENNIVKARDLNAAWRDTMWCCVENGIESVVKGGSYVGQIRRQLPYLTIVIEEPWTRPFKYYTPPGIPEPTDECKINEYFEKYIISDIVSTKEDYTYGQYICLQYERAIRILNDAEGNTNQATIQIGEPNSITLNDPPCLRTMSFTVYNGKLHLSVYFRSWDIFSGLPENLGGFQLFKEFVLSNLTFPVEDGPIIAYSSGAHLYEMYFPIVNQLNATKIEIKGE